MTIKKKRQIIVLQQRSLNALRKKSSILWSSNYISIASVFTLLAHRLLKVDFILFFLRR